MTVPPLRKWRPCISRSRSRGAGWHFAIHPHRDHNPIFLIQRWFGETFFEIGRLRYRTGAGWRISPRYF